MGKPRREESLGMATLVNAAVDQEFSHEEGKAGLAGKGLSVRGRRLEFPDFFHLLSALSFSRMLSAILMSSGWSTSNES